MGARSQIVAATAAPSALPDDVPRPRLVEQLDKRWSFPVVTLQAPGGYGKSTLLGQAIRRNLTNSGGIDYYVQCAPAHTDPTALLQAILRQFEDEADEGASAEQLFSDVLDQLRLRSPAQVALIFDDLHHLVGSEATEILTRLIRELPTNAHLVLAGRSLPRLPLARLRASDSVLSLSEADLAFNSDELDSLAAAHNTDSAQLVDSAGWPAVAGLIASLGIRESIQFLLEEVVANLEPELQSALRLAIVGTVVDDDLFDGLGIPVSVEKLAAEVPLVDLTSDGSVRTHDLWREALGDLMEEDSRQQAALAVVEWHQSAGRQAEAVETACNAKLWELGRRCVLEAVSVGDTHLTPTTTRRWFEMFPASEHAEPELQLLSGVAHRLENGIGHGVGQIDSAHSEFKLRGDIDGQVAAGFELATAAWAQGDSERLIGLYLEAVDVAATGARGMDTIIALADATVADLEGDPARAVSRLTEIDIDATPPSLAILALNHWSNMLALLGSTSHAVDVAARSATLVPNGINTFLHSFARFQDGDPRPFLEKWPRTERVSENARHQFLVGVKSAVVDASFGIPVDLSFTRYSLDRPRERAYIALTKAAAEVLEGHEQAAADVIATHLVDVPLDNPMNFGEFCRATTYGYVLSPLVREALEAAALGPKWTERRSLARYFLAARAAQPLDWTKLPDPAEVFCAFPLPWSCELACLAAAAEAPYGTSLAEYLVDAASAATRRHLHGIEQSDKAGSAGAALLLSSLTFRPADTLQIKLCGSVTVGQATDPGSHRSTSRGRVRQLLALLALREQVSREETMELLWPGSDRSRAANNLRVTLGHLRGLLEPERRKGERTFHLRVDSDTLRLHRSSVLDVDVWAIREHINQAQALTHRGRHGEAAKHHMAATELWTDDAFLDLRANSALRSEVAAFDSALMAAAASAGEWSLATADANQALEIAHRLLNQNPDSRRGSRLAASAIELADGNPGVRPFDLLGQVKP